MLKKMTKQRIKSTKQTIIENYKYNIGNRVIHLGGIYEQYRAKEATITSRSKYKAFYNYYEIVFDDGYKMEVKEEWIKGIENTESEDENNES